MTRLRFTRPVNPHSFATGDGAFATTVTLTAIFEKVAVTHFNQN
jgi:hypothetical protein